MIFEVGRKYVHRNGEVSTITEINNGGQLYVNRDIFYNDGLMSNCLYPDGKNEGDENPWDLISEYIKEDVKYPDTEQELSGLDGKYYDLPNSATELQDLIEHKNMNFSVGNIFKAVYRLGEKSGVDKKYDLEKIIYFAQRELERL